MAGQRILLIRGLMDYRPGISPMTSLKARLANEVALSDRDVPRLQTANDAIAASGRFRRYGPVRLDVCLQKMWGDHHPHNQN